MIRITDNRVMDTSNQDTARKKELPAPGFHMEWHLHRNKKASALKTLTKYNRLSKLQVSIGTIMIILGVLASIAAPLVIRAIIDGYKKGVNVQLVAWAVGLMIASAILIALGNYFFSLAGLTITRLMQNRAYQHLLRKPVAFFDTHSSGQLAGRLVNNLSMIKEYYSGGYPNLINGIVMVAASVLVLFFLNWPLTLGVLLTLPLFGIFLSMIGPRVIAPVEKYQNKLSDYSAMVTESFVNIRMIKANVAENTFDDQAAQYTKDLNRIGKRMAKVMAFVQPVMSTLLLGIIALIFALGGYMIAHGQMTNGTLVSFILFAFQIAGPISNFSSYVQTRKSAEGAAQSLQAQLAISDEEEGNDGKGEVKFKSNDVLQFNDVTMKYDGQHGVKNISLSLDNQKLYALVGPSGSGKSTFMGLIEQFYQPQAGNIQFGGKDIKTLTKQHWRNQLAYVPQVSEIVSGTFRTYLKMGKPDATDEELNQVIAEVGLRDLVARTSEGLDAPLREYGGNMSGGQRQRLTIAQALLRDAKVYLFDEVTANLDADSENIIRAIMRKLSSTHLVLSAAHRLSSIRDADAVIVLEDGQVTGMGTSDELSRTNQTYARYLKEQEL